MTLALMGLWCLFAFLIGLTVAFWLYCDGVLE